MGCRILHVETEKMGVAASASLALSRHVAVQDGEVEETVLVTERRATSAF